MASLRELCGREQLWGWPRQPYSEVTTVSVLPAACSGRRWTLGAIPVLVTGHWVLFTHWVTAGGYFSSLAHGVLSTVEKPKPVAEQYSSYLITPAWVSLSLILPSSTATETPQVVDDVKQSPTCSA